MTAEEEVAFRAAMLAEGYFGTRKLPTGEWAGVRKFIFTWGLCVGLTDFGLRTRYCYAHPMHAGLALLQWSGEGDPPGPWIKEKGAVERSNPLLFKDIPIVEETPT